VSGGRVARRVRISVRREEGRKDAIKLEGGGGGNE
jgi:hypothetical protein